MLRSRTTIVVGAGASCELGLPSSAELLGRIGQNLDFSRLGSAVQSRDMVQLHSNLQRLAARTGCSQEQALAAAERLRSACRLASSIDPVLDQHDTQPLVQACGKLALVHFIAQAEAKSILRHTPRVAGDLPIQGTETWLYQLAQSITTGVPRSRVEQCLENLAIVCFNYDRSIEHFLPHAFVMAFGMGLEEAQALVGERLRICHPYGVIGRLPWWPGGGAGLDWGDEQSEAGDVLFDSIRTGGELRDDAAGLAKIRAMMANACRLVFLGFGFQPQNMDVLLEHGLGHEAEVVATLAGLNEASAQAVTHRLQRLRGSGDAGGLQTWVLKANDVMRDYALVLES